MWLHCMSSQCSPPPLALTRKSKSTTKQPSWFCPYALIKVEPSRLISARCNIQRYIENIWSHVRRHVCNGILQTYYLTQQVRWSKKWVTIQPIIQPLEITCLQFCLVNFTADIVGRHFSWLLAESLSPLSWASLWFRRFETWAKEAFPSCRLKVEPSR